MKLKEKYNKNNFALALCLVMCYTLIMRVLRIQDVNGNGPYVGSLSELYDQLNTDTMQLPTPEQDCGIDRFPYKDEYCGFINQEQFDNWFGREDIKLLKEYGYGIVELDVEITAVGEYQVLFKINLTLN